MATERKVIDCSWLLTGQPCDITVTGSEDEVLDAALEHVIHFHCRQDTPDLREKLHALLRDEGQPSPLGLVVLPQPSVETLDAEMPYRPPYQRKMAA